jgi:RAB protein geranylgeranyltransferase component A
MKLFADLPGGAGEDIADGIDPSMDEFISPQDRLAILCDSSTEAYLQLSREERTTYTLKENKIRPLTDQELQITVSTFLGLGGQERCRKKEPVCSCSEFFQFLAGEAGLDYDPVQLDGWGP